MMDTISRSVPDMSYCLNPSCHTPQNADDRKFCQTCGTKILLKDRYRPIQPIGKGGFGRTFLSEDTDRLNTACAIKQFLPLPEIQGDSLAMTKAVELFEQEARNLLQLGEQHPQIPTLFAYIEQDKRLYLVQQYIDGQDLCNELEHHGAFSEQKIWELLSDLLPVLKFVHDRQIIHRDIKPSNILRRQVDNKLVLIDFGVSKQLTGITSLSKTGTGGYGTPVYAPIEQMRSGKVYPASDLYSLGVTCIQLLTRAPLDELYDPPTGRWAWREYLREKGKDVSDRLDRVLDKLLKDLVNERYQSALDVLKDLNYAPASTITPAPLNEHYRSVSQKFKNFNAQTSRPYSSTVPPIASAPLGTPSSASLKTQHDRFLHTLTGHSSYVYSVAFSPDGQIIASGSSDNTIKLWQLDTEGKPHSSPLHTLNGHSDWILSIAISPDGKSLASGSVDKTVKLWDIGTGELLNTFIGHFAPITSVAFSPDGQTIASTSWDRTIELWQLEGRASFFRSAPSSRLRTLTGHSGYVYCVAFSPDGQTIASASWDNTVKLWQTSTGKLLHTLKGHSGYVRFVAFSPDGTTLASASADKTIKIWHLGSGGQLQGTPPHTLKGHSNWVRCVAFSPDGTILASGSEDKTIELWHLESGKLLDTLTGHSGSVYSVAFSRNGGAVQDRPPLLASSGEDKTIKFWRWN